MNKQMNVHVYAIQTDEKQIWYDYYCQMKFVIGLIIQQH